MIFKLNSAKASLPETDWGHINEICGKELKAGSNMIFCLLELLLIGGTISLTQGEVIKKNIIKRNMSDPIWPGCKNKLLSKSTSVLILI